MNALPNQTQKRDTMLFGKLNINPARNPAILDTATWSPDVAICDMLEEEGRRTAAEIAALGRRAHFVRVDVTRSDEIGAFVQTAIDRLGKIDILMNNAGIPSDGLSLEDESDEA